MLKKKSVGFAMRTIIDETTDYVRELLGQQLKVGTTGGTRHRVWHNAQQIAEQEGGNLFIIELSALLHDVADAKFNGGDEEEGPRLAVAFLKRQRVATPVIDAVAHIIRYVSFRKKTPPDVP